ncbi:hypothetical protein [Cellulophaga sp. Asnod2-G02]|uniref:hypothetical protein n=1 Tax=Cellulophaga sp. Asnod2-G02 TaxID=3160572 RepID=UPI00386C519C
MRILLTFLILGIFISQGIAQTCCSGGVPLSNNLGLPNDGKGVLVVGLNYDYNNLNTLNAGTVKLDDSSRQRVTNSVLLNVGYSFTDKFAIETLLTWVNQSRTITQFGNQNFTETSGVGDAVILFKYSIPAFLGNRTVLNLGVGAKLPLGDSDILSDQGIQLTADLQPGSGAWDGLVWASASKSLNFRPSTTVSGSITYRFTGVNNAYLNNEATYEFGDEIQANIGFSDQLLVLNTIINPGIVFKYRKAFGDRIDTQEIPNTGGQWVFLRPQVTVQLSSSLAINSRLELPIYSDVEGTQLTPTLRFSTGISFKLPNKKKVLIN